MKKILSSNGFPNSKLINQMDQEIDKLLRNHYDKFAWEKVRRILLKRGFKEKEMFEIMDECYSGKFK